MTALQKYSQSALLLAALAAFLGGSIPVFAKIALVVFPPFVLTSIRFFFATAFLLPLVYRSRELNRATLRELFLAGFIGSLNPILLFIALQFTQASVSPLIYASVPAMTALYLMRFRQQPITTKQMLGIAMGLLGVAIIVLLPMFEQGAQIADPTPLN